MIVRRSAFAIGLICIGLTIAMMLAPGKLYLAFFLVAAIVGARYSLPATFCAFLALMPLVHKSGVTYVAAPRVEILLLMVLGIWLIQVAFARATLVLRRSDWWLLAFVICAGVSAGLCAFARARASGTPLYSAYDLFFTQTPSDTYYPLRPLITVCEGVLAYLCARSIFQPRHHRWVVLALTAPMLVIVPPALYHYFTVDNSSAFRGVRRAVAVFYNPNETGTYMAIVVALLVGWTTAVRDRTRPIAVALTLVCTTVLILTKSRGAWVALIVVGTLWTWWLCRQRPFSRYFAAILFLPLIPIVAAIITLMRLPPDRVDDITHGRYFIFWAQWRALTAHPLFGIGFGNLQQALADYYPPHIDVRELATHGHSWPLQTLAELGIVGFGLRAMMVGAPLLRIFRRRGSLSPLEAGALFAVVAIMSHSLVDNPILWAYFAILFWSLIGMLDSAAPRAPVRPGSATASR